MKAIEHLLLSILKNMYVPAERLDLSNNENLVWLANNLHIRNKNDNEYPTAKHFIHTLAFMRGIFISGKIARYGIVNKQGELVRVEFSDNSNAEFCNLFTVELTKDKDGPEFFSEKLEDVISVLKEDVKWFNSSYTHPCWGDYDNKEIKELKPVVIEMEVKRIVV